MAIQKVKEYFKKFGMDNKIMEFETSSATVDLAAKAVGTDPERICKTLSFQKPEGGCVLIQTSGNTKVNGSKFKKQFGFKGKMLTPEQVLEYTGHEIGGVCAFAISNNIVDIYVDESIKKFHTVYPACGSSNSAIELTPQELFDFSNSIKWIDVCDIIE